MASSIVMKTTRYKRPESVLVVIYTAAGEVLLLERQHPRGFWQSVTGSLEAGEDPVSAARREVYEETGLVAEKLVDTGETRRFPILPAWRERYAPEVSENLEHWLLLPLPHRQAIEISPQEHHNYLWLARSEALLTVSSATNRAAIERYVPESIQ